jgi:hypothetical protein
MDVGVFHERKSNARLKGVKGDPAIAPQIATPFPAMVGYGASGKSGGDISCL